MFEHVRSTVLIDLILILMNVSLSLLRDEIQSDIIQFLIQFFFYREENSFIFDSQQQNFEFEITKSFSKLIFL